MLEPQHLELAAGVERAREVAACAAASERVGLPIPATSTGWVLNAAIGLSCFARRY